MREQIVKSGIRKQRISIDRNPRLEHLVEQLVIQNLYLRQLKRVPEDQPFPQQFRANKKG